MLFRQKGRLHQAAECAAPKQNIFRSIPVLSHTRQNLRHAFTITAIGVSSLIFASGLHAQAPKVKVEVEGWTATIRIPENLGNKDEFHYMFTKEIGKNSKDSVSLLVFRDVWLQHAVGAGDYSDAHSDGAAVGVMWNGGPKEVKVRLCPGKENRLRIDAGLRESTLKDGETWDEDEMLVKGPKKYCMHLDTTIVPNSIVVPYGNVKVVCEDLSLRENALKIAKGVFLINRLISEKDRTVFFALYEKATCYNPHDSTIAMQISDSVDYLATAAHEIAHAFFNEKMSRDEQVKMGALHAKIMDMLAWPKEPKNVPFLKLFKESAYLFGKDEKMGHPWHDEDEFFASTTAILINFPVQFLDKLGGLEQSNPQQAKIAKDAAKSVIAAYGDNSLFPKELLKALEIE